MHRVRRPLTVIGAGSNALILDGGVRGLAVRPVSKDVTTADAVVTLAAGAMMPRVALDLARVGVGRHGVGHRRSRQLWRLGVGQRGRLRRRGGEQRWWDCEVVAPDGTTRWIGVADCGFAYRDPGSRTTCAVMS